jgi:hypothetical protein
LTSFLWFWKAHYALKRVPFNAEPVARVKIDYGIYKRPSFPLNNQEWSLLLRRGESSFPQE